LPSTANGEPPRKRDSESLEDGRWSVIFSWFDIFSLCPAGIRLLRTCAII
jgi:hypothetical protein